MTENGKTLVRPAIVGSLSEFHCSRGTAVGKTASATLLVRKAPISTLQNFDPTY